MLDYSGIHVPVITPFHDDFSIDWDAYKTMLQTLVDANVQGIVVGGTTGEYYAMSHDERLKSFEMAREVIPDAMIMTAGIGALRTEDAIELGQAARSIGTDCILLGSPYYALPDEQELTYHLTRVIQKIALPTVLYNYPDRTGVNMTAAVLNDVARNNNILAIKESSGDINRLHMLARNYKHIQLCCGMDDQALEFFAWGAKSWICGAGNFLPQAHLALYRSAAIEQEFTKARAIMTAMLPMLQVLEQGGKFIQCIKFGCQLKGMPAGTVRRPLRSLRYEKELKRMFRETLERTEMELTDLLNP